MGKLYDKLTELEYENILPMHMPGSKRNSELMSMPDPVKMDITEITGFDNLHNATGIIKECAIEAARIFGADETCLLVNGSTAGVMAAICGATHSGDKVLVARNVHRSVINALYLGQLNPEYIFPEMKCPEAGIYGAVKPEDIEEAFKESSDIKAVIITSPTYEGIVSDISAISEIVHRYGAVFIVDQAHGAHFGFNKEFPESAVRQGADAVITSVHKTLPALTQTALLHINRGRIDADRVKMFWNMFQSTSPSYILMGSIDNCVTILKEKGDYLFKKYVERLKKLRNEIDKLRYINLLPVDDISKIVLLVNDGGEFARQLRQIYKIELEMASEKYVIAMTSMGDTDEGYARFLQALREMDREEYSSVQSNNSKLVYPEIAMSIYEALNSPTEMSDFDNSVGRIAGEAVCIYPPGINLVNPGEVITEGVVNALKAGLKDGLEILGMSEDLQIRCLKNI
ncbi:MAG: aminotransferase class I/II-fold pyridoxal phosphate-dependent enzyme [Lachnospira sp.]